MHGVLLTERRVLSATNFEESVVHLKLKRFAHWILKEQVLIFISKS